MKRLSLATCIGMFIVLWMGALVTSTDAGRGCGTDWPLCNGKFVPAYTLESLTEYSHRAVSGIVGLLVAATLIVALIYWKNRRDVKLYAASAFLFTALQAFLGALAVVWEQSSAVLALHFGISLLAFASTLMLVVAVRTKPDQEASRALSVSNGYRWGVWLVAIYSYVVVYLGAFVRHTDSASACTGWPLCNGQLIPELTGGVAIAFWHRVAAFLLLVAVLWMAVAASKQYVSLRGVYRGARWSLYLVVTQVVSGIWVAAPLSEDAHLYATLTHISIVAAFFATLCYVCAEVWVQRNKLAST